MAGIYSQGGSAGHRYAGWLSEVEAKNFTFGGKVFNGSPSAIYVGSNLVWAGRWLTVAAAQAILGAFGQRDGMAVINATNAYLNQLAASGQAGKDKATALAGFINEDPMMVCSLGLEVEGVTMPKRYCVSDSGSGTTVHAYIKTGFTYSNDLQFKAISSNLCMGVHSNPPIGAPCMYLQPVVTGTTYALDLAGTWYSISAMTTETLIAELTSTQVIIKDANGVADRTVSRPSAINKEVYIFASNEGSSIYGAGNKNMVELLMWDNSKSIHLVPFKKQGGECGMLDLNAIGVEGAQTFYGNANSSGQFTIPDISYTPSTP